MVVAFFILLAVGLGALALAGKHASARYVLYVVLACLGAMLLLGVYIYVNIHVLGNY